MIFEMNSVIIYPLSFSFVTLIIFYIFYYTLGYLYGKDSMLDKYRTGSYIPKVSLITATYNEEKIIKNKLENILKLDYPHNKMEIIFIDCSNDNTLKILNSFKDQSNLDIKIIHEDIRKGLAYALNLGYSIATGDVVVKSDCDILLKPDSINHIVSFLEHSEVGCVSGTGIADNYLEMSYRNIQLKLRIAESNLYSTYLFDTFSCFRRELIEPIDDESMADDAELALKVIRKGYRALMNPKAQFYETCPMSFKERRKQRDRRAEGHVRLLLKNMDIFLNPKFGLFGILIFPSIVFMMIISPWLTLMTLILSFIMLSLLLKKFWIFSTILILVLIFISYKLSILSSIAVYLDTQLSLIIAQTRILFGKKSYIWEKNDRYL